MLKGNRRPSPDEIQIIAGLINASFEEVVAAWAVRSPLVGQKGFAEMNQVEFEPLPKDLLTGTAPSEKLKHHPAYGSLKGMVTILPGGDLTKPAFENWKELYEEE